MRFGVARAREREREDEGGASENDDKCSREIEQQRRSSRMSSSFCLSAFACVYL
jgi:hypothetical protein